MSTARSSPSTIIPKTIFQRPTFHSHAMPSVPSQVALQAAVVQRTGFSARPFEQVPGGTVSPCAAPPGIATQVLPVAHWALELVLHQLRSPREGP